MTWWTGIRRACAVGVAVLVASALAAAALAGGFMFAIVRYARSDLPVIRAISAGQFPQDTIVVDRHGYRLAAIRSSDGHREVVARAGMSPYLVDAVIASEDARFWTHHGVDPYGILRAAVANIRHRGTHVQGGSTITQQLLKLAFLGDRPSLVRKVEEAMLARAFESLLTKAELPPLYLNAVYFGHGYSGVEAAARGYFGTSASGVTLAEAALLVGIIPAPSEFSPFCAADATRARQRLVLDRMVAVGAVARAEADAAATATPRFRLSDDTLAQDVVASAWDGARDTHASSDLIVTAVDTRLQIAATRALRDGIAQYARRKGEHRGPRVILAPSCAWHAQLRALRETLRAWGMTAPLVYDIRSAMSACPPPPCRSGAALFRRMTPGDLATGIVTAVARDAVTLDLGDRSGVLRAKATAWIRQPISDGAPLGAVVDVRLPLRIPSDPSVPLEVELVPRPHVEGAVVVLDPRSREVLAMVGGVAPARGQLNRALRARRSIGSTVKPFVFASALATGALAADAIVVDAPVTYVDPWSAAPWTPANWYAGHRGPMPFPEALARSVNTVTVAAALSASPEAVAALLEGIGVPARVPAVPSLALGTVELTPLDLANAFAVIASGGYAAAPTMLRTSDASEPVGVRVLTPEFVGAMDWLLAQPIVHPAGTARRLRHLGLRIRGKTGTSDGARDAWFVGYTPEILVVVWVGYDTPAELRTGRGEESGGSLAAPIAEAIFAAASEMRVLSPEDPVPELPPAFAAVFTEHAPATARAAFPSFPPEDPHVHE